VLELHVEEEKRAVLRCLLKVVIEYSIMQAIEDISLARQEDHLEILQVLHQEHASMHHMQ